MLGEVDFEGGLQYGGGFWRRILEADFIWSWIVGADFNMELDFFMTGADFFWLVKAKPLILCLRSTTRGGLNK